MVARALTRAAFVSPEINLSLAARLIACRLA
jgi:hypothetical protein